MVIKKILIALLVLIVSLTVFKTNSGTFAEGPLGDSGPTPNIVSVSGRTRILYNNHTWMNCGGVVITVTRVTSPSVTALDTFTPITITSGPGTEYFLDLPEGIYNFEGTIQVDCRIYTGIRSEWVVTGTTTRVRPLCLTATGLGCRYYLPTIWRN